MQKLERFIPYLLLLGFLCFAGYLLQDVQQYVFFHREQQQILVWDADFLFNRYHGIGGFSLFLAQFLTQFFCKPYCGALCTAMLFACAVWLLWQGMKKVNDAVWLFPLCILPVGFELSNLNDAYYQYQGFVAFVLMALFLSLYAFVADKLQAYWRVGVGCGMALLLFCWTGPTALPFAACLCVYDAVSRKEKWYAQLASLLWVAMACFYAVRWCWMPNMRSGFSHDFYYNPLIPAPASFKYSWIAIIVLPIVCRAARKLNVANLKLRLTLTVVLAVAVCGYGYTMAEKNRENADVLHELQHHAIVEDWDAILNNPIAYSRNSLVMNYVNLALSKKGMLLSHLFAFEQPDENNILVFREVDDTNLPLSFIYALVTYQMGDQGAAQNNAFDTFVGTTYGNPCMLQMLIKTNLIGRAYPVAEKYIRMMEKTWMYGDWAKEMRKFLHNEDAINADPELGRMRKSLAKDDTFTLDTFLALFKTLDANPADKVARDYLIAYLLLNRDKDYLNQFVEQFQHTPALDPMPKQVEEMLLMVNEPDFDYCRAHGVQEETIRRFQQMVMEYEEAVSQNANPAATLKKEYGQTVWYHFLFN